MLTLAPVAASKRLVALDTTAGQPFCASLCSQTVTVLPLPSTDRTLSSCEFEVGLLEPPHALTTMVMDAATTTAPASLRFTPVSS